MLESLYDELLRKLAMIRVNGRFLRWEDSQTIVYRCGWCNGEHRCQPDLVVKSLPDQKPREETAIPDAFRKAFEGGA